MLFCALLMRAPQHRPPLVTLLSHSWFDEGGGPPRPDPRPRNGIQLAIVKQLVAAGLNRHLIQASLTAKRLDHFYAAYALIEERHAEAELTGRSSSKDSRASSSKSSTRHVH